ncbi:hypothetical protein TcasGA2_TC032109 [Tribolium castaneum]|uniref:Uncharacterized protein n=1 Tax=Tribolium castaneum TaxID=7070 RepID=A0A139WMK5_TRICA|nr:hypothetical protein TcasGA2_TC032109 [Tribolium castaneum]
MSTSSTDVIEFFPRYDCESDIRRMVVAVNCLTVTKLNEDVFLKIIKKITSLHVNALHLPCRSEFV